MSELDHPAAEGHSCQDDCDNSLQTPKNKEGDTSAKEDLCLIQPPLQNILKYVDTLYRCSLCRSVNVMLDTKEAVVTHMRNQHFLSSASDFPCSVCSLRFQAAPDLEIHKKSNHHEKPSEDTLRTYGCLNDESSTHNTFKSSPNKETTTTCDSEAAEFSTKLVEIVKVRRETAVIPPFVQDNIPVEKGPELPFSEVQCQRLRSPVYEGANRPQNRSASAAPANDIRQEKSKNSLANLQKLTSEIMAFASPQNHRGNSGTSLQMAGQSSSDVPIVSSPCFTQEFGKYTKLVREGGNIVYFCQLCNWKSPSRPEFQTHCRRRSHVARFNMTEKGPSDSDLATSVQETENKLEVKPLPEKAFSPVTQANYPAVFLNAPKETCQDGPLNLATKPDTIKSVNVPFIKKESADSEPKKGNSLSSDETEFLSGHRDTRVYTSRSTDTKPVCSEDSPKEDTISRHKRKRVSPIMIRNQPEEECDSSDSNSGSDRVAYNAESCPPKKHKPSLDNSYKTSNPVVCTADTVPIEKSACCSNIDDKTCTVKVDPSLQVANKTADGSLSANTAADIVDAKMRTESSYFCPQSPFIFYPNCDPLYVVSNKQNYKVNSFARGKDDGYLKTYLNEGGSNNDNTLPKSDEAGSCDGVETDLETTKTSNGEGWKILKIREILPDILDVSCSGNISRDLLLLKISHVLQCPDAINWGPACNRAVREEFPHCVAQRKGKYKKDIILPISNHNNDPRQQNKRFQTSPPTHQFIDSDIRHETEARRIFGLLPEFPEHAEFFSFNLFKHNLYINKLLVITDPVKHPLASFGDSGSSPKMHATSFRVAPNIRIKLASWRASGNSFQTACSAVADRFVVRNGKEDISKVTGGCLKTYFFGVQYLEQLTVTHQDVNGESISFQPLRDMSLDTEKILHCLPELVCWSGDMETGVPRDELLRLLVERIHDSDVLVWGIECNRAVRRLYPDVHTKRRGKYKTVFYGLRYRKHVSDKLIQNSLLLHSFGDEEGTADVLDGSSRRPRLEPCPVSTDSNRHYSIAQPRIEIQDNAGSVSPPTTSSAD